MRTSSLLLAAGLGLALAHPEAQAPPTGTLTGTLTIKTKGATTAVHGSNPDKSKGDFLFCIDQDRTAPQAVDFTGRGRVMYQPMPQLDAPAGVTITGPEMVAHTLAVIADDGKAWLFVGEGQKPLLPADDRAFTTAKRVNVRGLRRTDWARKYGTRAGTDIDACLAPGG
jgi:hypothetical protein